MKVVQCWDDGVLDDIGVIEILRRHGARGSFNLNLGLHRPERFMGWKFRDTKEVWKLSLGELQSVYQGFTIANHTLTHPHLAKIPLDEATRNIREGRERLEQMFGCAVTGFAYPFGDHNEAVRDAVRATGHLYARTTGNVDNVFPPQDPMAFHANCHFLAGDFWTKYEAARTRGDAVFYFWGHSYELVTREQWQDFDAKIARISADPQASWADLPELFQ